MILESGMNEYFQSTTDYIRYDVKWETEERERFSETKISESKRSPLR